MNSQPSPLVRLAEEFGQSPWLDNLQRSALHDGSLRRLIDDGIRGMTSNPTIFKKAIVGSDDYDAQLAQLVAAGASLNDAYWDMVVTDIEGALDQFAVVFERTGGADGFVSVEVDAALAGDTEGTIAAARGLHERIARENLMVKIPATPAGVPAIRAMVAEGRKINVTLIFSLERYAEVIEAYLSGLEEYAKDPAADLSKVTGIGSFFISRVDTEIDRRLEAIGTERALALRGKGALAQGKLAYRLFTEAFGGPRWEALAARGATLQRPLWASTSTKNPAYPDTLYVDELIGPHTVNTLPEATIAAFVDHGTLARRVDADVDDAQRTWDDLAEVGVDLTDVGATLEHQGVTNFEHDFATLMDTLRAKVDETTRAS